MADQSEDKTDGFVWLFLESFIPVWVVGSYCFFVLPSTGSPAFSSLAWYQQAGSVAFLPAMLWSMWRFHKRTERDKRTPEERILDQ